jgi:hypothetical protein
MNQLVAQQVIEPSAQAFEVHGAALHRRWNSHLIGVFVPQGFDLTLRTQAPHPNEPTMIAWVKYAPNRMTATIRVASAVLRERAFHMSLPSFSRRAS